MDYLVFLAKTGRYELAQEVFGRAILLKSCSSNDKVYVPYANILIQANRNSEAENVLEKALPNVKRYSLSQVYIMYGQALENQRKFEQAEVSFDKGVKIIPIQNGLDDVYLKYCKFLIRRRKFDKAILIITEALSKLPPKRLVELYVEYSKLLRQQGKNREAIVVLEEGINKVPSKFNLYSLYWEYCDLLKSQKDISGAINVLRRGIKHVSLEHKGDALIIEYSKIARNLGDRQEVEKALKHGIQNTPLGEGLKILYLDYSNLLLYQSRYDEAISSLDEALSRLPKRSHGVIKLKRNEIVEEQQSRESRKSKEDIVQNQYFEKGKHYEPYVLIKNLLQSATAKIVIIDSYIDEQIIRLISTLEKKPSILIFGNKISPADFCVQINKLKSDGFSIRVFKTNVFHDRFLGVDSNWWHSGHSFKDIGNKVSMMTKIDEATIQNLNKDVENVVQSTPEYC